MSNIAVVYPNGSEPAKGGQDLGRVAANGKELARVAVAGQEGARGGQDVAK